MLELWDAYDNQFNKLDNIVLVRGDEIPDGIYHLVCEIAVRHTDGQYLLMQRDKRKHFGGMWELTAGGSALKGELPLECAVRELREETGICSENLIEIGRVFIINIILFMWNIYAISNVTKTPFFFKKEKQLLTNG